MKKLTVEIVMDQKDQDMITLLGGNDRNPTWDEYISDFKPEYHKKMNLIKECIKKSDWYLKTADKFCNDNHFRFSDGTEIAFTWRAWGDLMQAIVGKREGYMTYYM